MAQVPPEQTRPHPRRSRSPNMRSTIYQGNDGRWNGRVTVGVRDDGRPDRRHVRGKTRSEVAEKVRALERARDQGTVRKVSERWTVGRWLTYWVENIAAPPHVAENTHLGYRVDVNRHLVPGLGAHRLERLTPDHVERLYAKLQGAGLSPGGVHHVHRTLRAALNEAVRRSHLARNPVLLAKAPKLDPDEVEPYDVPEIQRLLEAAAKRRNSARWALALALGLRQGEALGLTWDDVDLDKGTIRVRRSRLRPRYAHGCGGTCGKTARPLPSAPEHPSTHRRSQVQGWPPHDRPATPARGPAAHPSGRAGSRADTDAASSGTTKAGYSPPQPASRSTRAPITTSGSGFSRTLGCAMPGYTTPGTPPPPCSWSCASRRRPSCH